MMRSEETNVLEVGKLSWQLVFHAEPSGKEFQQTIKFNEEHHVRPAEFWNFIERNRFSLEIPDGLVVNELQADFQSVSTHHMVIVDELVSAINNRQTIHKSNPFQRTAQVPSERSLKVYQLAVRVPGCTIKTDVVTLVTSPETTLEEVSITARIFKQLKAKNGVEPGVYRIISTFCNGVRGLDIAGPESRDGANVHIYELHHGVQQQWRIEHVRGGEFKIVSEFRGHRCLDIQSCKNKNGANIHTWSHHDGASQRWRFEPMGDGNFRIVSVHCNEIRAIDIDGPRSSNSTNVHLWELHGGNSQIWKLERVK